MLQESFERLALVSCSMLLVRSALVIAVSHKSQNDQPAAHEPLKHVLRLAGS